MLIIVMYQQLFYVSGICITSLTYGSTQLLDLYAMRGMIHMLDA